MPAPFATDPFASRGRLTPERENMFRSVFQRDRDRIIHASAFRRLKHKTQVFVADEGDYFRTRLTHTLEVAQAARAIARALGVNEDLTETVALAHDLGHPPFGHAGEKVLAMLMSTYGGFDHNAQAIRIVTDLERHYADFDGLNLTWEALEGIAKHNGPVAAPIPWALAAYVARHDLELAAHAGAEAQVAAIADDIAYNHHDLQDGLRAGLFTPGDLGNLPILDGCFAQVQARYPNLDPTRRRHEVLRRFFDILVADVIKTTRDNLADLAPKSVADIRGASRQMVAFSKTLTHDLGIIRDFLHHRMYRAPHVMAMRAQAADILTGLFHHFLKHPNTLPQEWRAMATDLTPPASPTALARLISDYIAGMTDRFAFDCYRRFVSAEMGKDRFD